MEQTAPRWISLLILIFLISGCNAFGRSEASIVHVYSIDGLNYYGLGLTKQTRELMLGHSGLGFIVESYSFKLAKKPKGKTVYPFTRVALTEAYSRTEEIAAFSSGQIVVDLDSRRVSVSLRTQKGDFPGNGEYPLTYIHMPVGCPEPDWSESPDFKKKRQER